MLVLLHWSRCSLELLFRAVGQQHWRVSVRTPLSQSWSPRWSGVRVCSQWWGTCGKRKGLLSVVCPKRH